MIEANKNWKLREIPGCTHCHICMTVHSDSAQGWHAQIENHSVAISHTWWVHPCTSGPFVCSKARCRIAPVWLEARLAVHLKCLVWIQACFKRPCYRSQRPRKQTACKGAKYSRCILHLGVQAQELTGQSSSTKAASVWICISGTGNQSIQRLELATLSISFSNRPSLRWGVEAFRWSFKWIWHERS